MASRLPNLSQDNISLHTIPFVWLIALAPRFWARKAYYDVRKQDMDVRHPRDFAKSVANDDMLDERTRGRIIRAEAAVQNGIDNVGLFAAAIVAGNCAKLSTKTLNGLALGYVLSRAVYNYVYVCNETKLQAAARAATFWSGLGMCFALFIQAGRKMK